LRAIAILAVVGFHAFPFWVKGGFIGVDVFFVISGYLISTIIIGSLERNSFSFVDFYIRRIKRIFPALLFVLIACLAFGWVVLFADEYKNLGKHIAGGAGFISNFLLWNESGYFDNAAETKPLLHLWSLGVEEQFYIIWPLLLWFAWKQRLNLLGIAIVVGVISFALNIYEVRNHAVATFYSPQTRFWELMAGSILAYMTRHRQNMFSSKFKHRLDAWLRLIGNAQSPEANGITLRNIQSLLGALLIAGGVLVITKERHFPGWWAVLPILGAVLIISAGARCQDKELSNTDELQWCLVNPHKKSNAALIGDSHADDKFLGIAQADMGRNWMFIGHNSCPPVYGISVEGSVKDCQQKTEKIINWLAKSNEIETVALSFYGNYFLTTAYVADHIRVNRGPQTVKITSSEIKSATRTQIFYNGLHNAIKLLEESGKRVVLMIDVPELPFFPRDCLRNPLKKGCQLTRHDVDLRQSEQREIVSKLQEFHPTLIVYDPIKLFCSTEFCGFQDGERILYRDSHHLTVIGGDFYAQHFVEWLDQSSRALPLN
jgi:peptidoglycan/LPS O-acetylase OafA/YrhL